MPEVERESYILPFQRRTIHHRFLGVQSLVFSIVFCRSLFVPFSIFFWSLYCLYFFDLRLQITLWCLQTFLFSKNQRWRYVLSKTFQCEDMSCLILSKDEDMSCLKHSKDEDMSCLKHSNAQLASEYNVYRGRLYWV